MARPSFPTNFREFQQRFPDELACQRYLAQSRWPNGYVCPGCGHQRAYEVSAWVKSRGRRPTRSAPRVKLLWQCVACGTQTSATAGTLLDHTRLPLRTWFHAAFLVATDKRGLSALYLDEQLGLGSHTTAWFLLHKLRRAMVNPDRSRLHGTVEIDGSYVGGYQPGLKGGRQQAGRQSAMVLMAVEVLDKTWQDRAGVEHSREVSGRIRAEVVWAETAEHVGDFITRNVEPGSTIRSDGLGAYSAACAELGYTHLRRVQGNVRKTGQVVPLAHRAIGNLKAWLNGTHHGVGRLHLQAYLDEFVFRFNRRQSPEAAFQTLLGLSSRHPSMRRAELVRANDLPDIYGDRKPVGDEDEQEETVVELTFNEATPDATSHDAA